MNHKLALAMSILEEVQSLTQELNQLGNDFKEAKPQVKRTRKKVVKRKAKPEVGKMSLPRLMNQLNLQLCISRLIKTRDN